MQAGERLKPFGARAHGRRAKAVPSGSITAMRQEKTQGIARRSAMRLETVREAGREPIFRSASSITGVDWRK